MSDARAALPSRETILIRGAYVMTMEPSLGDLPAGDVLIKDGAIVDLGKGLTATDAAVIDGRGMIALPGFVDTHWHLWNSTLRAFINYIEPSEGYFRLTMRLGPLSTPHDAYCNVRMAIAEGLLSGITTVHDWAHNLLTPAHADAEVRALQDMGIRGRFSYGWGQDLPVEERMNAKDVARIKRDIFDGDDMLGLGVALRTPVAYQRGNVPIEILKDDWLTARALGLPVTMHNRPGAVTILHEHGMLGPELLLVHPQGFTPQEIEWLRASRVAVSSSPVIENARGFNTPRGAIQFSELLAAGIPWSISVDEVATGGKADFFAVLRELLRSDWQRAGDWTKISPRRILELATIGGARALGLDDKVGSLKPGKRADIILVRTTDLNMTPTLDDPSMMLVFSAQPGNVDTVLVDGRVLVRTGQFSAFDSGAIIRDADQSARALRERDRTRARTSASAITR